MCFKFPDKVEEEEEKAESAKMASAALSPTDRNVSTGATAIVFVVCFLLVFIVFYFIIFFLFTVLPCNLIGAEAISPNTHFVLCFSKFCLAWSTASCKRKRNVA